MKKESTHQEIAQLIVHHRKVAGLSQLQLAELAGVGKTVIFDIEHGKPSVRLDTLLKVLHALNIQIHFRSPLSE
jgi:y4mF family transcriptional regulator